GVIPITDPEMTRFNVSLEEEADIVLLALSNAWGGELFIPKLASFRITDLAKAICPECKLEVIGLRPAEKIHEDLITEADSVNTVEFDKYFVILPSIPVWDAEKWKNTFKGKMVAPGFRYNSAKNERWLSVEDLRTQIMKYVDPEFAT
ncbi:MAG: polysaccharide biosynthesis protein, partial [Cytophagaceae bacterium]